MAVVSDIEIRLRADIARLQQDMTAARRSVDTAMEGITRAATIARNSLSGLAAGFGISEIIKISDQYAKFTAQLRIATDTTAEYSRAYADVARIAKTSNADLSATGSLYARIANGTKELGISQQKIADIVEATNLSLKVSNATTEESSSAILQLSQAFGSGVLRGEEFNAVNEASPRLMKALADGLGVPTGALKNMASEGKITAQVMADVLPKALDSLRNEAKQVQTIAGSFQLLKNNVMEFVGTQSQASGTVSIITSGMNLLAENLSAVASAIGVVVGAKLIGWLSSMGQEALAAAAAKRALLNATVAEAEAAAASTAAASLNANAYLAEARASTLAATGNERLAFATNSLIPMQARAAVAAEAHTVAMTELTVAQRAASLGTAALAAGTTALNSAMALVGGPIGLIITALGIAAIAWNTYGDKAAEANAKAAGATEKSTNEIIDKLNAQEKKLRERLELSKQAGLKDAAKAGGEEVERLAQLGQQIRDMQNAIKTGAGGSTGGFPNNAVNLGGLQYQYDTLAKTIERVANTKKQLESSTDTEKLTEWFAKNTQYLDKAQKTQAAIAAAKKELGTAFNADVEKRIRDSFSEADTKKAETAYQNLTNTIKAKIAESEKEIESGKNLTESQKLQIKFNEEVRLGKIKISEASKKATQAEIDSLAASEQRLKAYQAQREVTKYINESTLARKASAAALVVEYEMYGKSADARAIAMVAVENEIWKEKELAKLREEEKPITDEIIAKLSAEAKERTKVQQATLAQTKALGYAYDLMEENKRFGLDYITDDKARAAAQLELDADVWKERIKNAGDGTEAQRKLQENFDVWYRNQSMKPQLDEQKKFWTSIEQTAHDTFVSIMDGGKDVWTRLKDSAKNIFFEWLYQMTLKKWIINIQGKGSLSSSIMDIYKKEGFTGLFDAGKDILAGFSKNISSTLGGAISKLGETFGSKAATSFGSSISSSASAGGIAAAVVAGMMANNAFYDQGWKIDGQVNDIIKSQFSSMFKGNVLGPIIGVMTASMSSFEKILKGIGINGKFASMLSGSAVFARAFGRKAPEIQAQGISGTVSSSGFNGGAFADILEKGGWFRSDKRYTNTVALGADQQSAFDSTIGGIIDSVRAFSQILGVSTSTIDGYTKQVNVTLTKDDAENQKLIEAMFSGIGDELSQRVLPNIAQFQKAGETASEALQRVATDFAAVDGIMAQLGVDSQTAFRAVGVAAIEAKERLIDLAGGLENLVSQTSYFYDNFLTKAEQIAPVQKEVTDQLTLLGYAGIKTASQFKDVVMGVLNSSSVAFEGGAKTYETLLALAPKFKQVNDYLIEIAKNGVDVAMGALGRAVDAQKDIVTKAYNESMTLLQTRIDGVSDSISRMTDLSQALKGALVGVDAPGSGEASRAAADAQIATALAIAKASGVLPSADDLRDALSTLTADSSNQFSSLADYQRAVARSNSQLSQLGDLTDSQLSTAELQLKTMQDLQTQSEAAYNAELSRLDAMVTQAQAQLDAINGVNTSVMSVNDAMVWVYQAIRDLQGVQGVIPTVNAPTIPVVSQPQQSGTMTTNESVASNFLLARIEKLLQNIAETNDKTAKATGQFSQEFSNVSAGGNALLVDQA